MHFFISLFRSVFIAISQDGRLTTNAYMAEYNQDRFELEIQAKEVQPPERIAKARVFVSIIFSSQNCIYACYKTAAYMHATKSMRMGKKIYLFFSL